MILGWWANYCVLASPASVLLRQSILQSCREDLYRFLEEEKGQVAIYDAVNPTAAGRRQLAKEFAKREILVGYKVLFWIRDLFLTCYRQYSLSRNAMTKRLLRRMSAKSRSLIRMYVYFLWVKGIGRMLINV